MMKKLVGGGVRKYLSITLPRREATRCSFPYEGWCQSLDLARDWLC